MNTSDVLETIKTIFDACGIPGLDAETLTDDSSGTPRESLLFVREGILYGESCSVLGIPFPLCRTADIARITSECPGEDPELDLRLDLHTRDRILYVYAPLDGVPDVDVSVYRWDAKRWSHGLAALDHLDDLATGRLDDPSVRAVEVLAGAALSAHYAVSPKAIAQLERSLRTYLEAGQARAGAWYLMLALHADHAKTRAAFDRTYALRKVIELGAQERFVNMLVDHCAFAWDEARLTVAIQDFYAAVIQTLIGEEVVFEDRVEPGTRYFGSLYDSEMPF